MLHADAMPNKLMEPTVASRPRVIGRALGRRTIIAASADPGEYA
jgi:hypothetical protein